MKINFTCKRKRWHSTLNEDLVRTEEEAVVILDGDEDLVNDICQQIKEMEDLKTE